MSKKDFDEYYFTVFKQYIGLNESLKEISEEVNKGMMDPDRLEQLKQTIQPVKSSFETLSYIKYLLDKPTRKSKSKGYAKRSSKLITMSKNNKREDIIKRNDDVLHKLKYF